MSEHRLDNIFDQGWHSADAGQAIEKMFDEILLLSKSGELDENVLGEIFDDLYQEFEFNFKDKILNM